MITPEDLEKKIMKIKLNSEEVQTYLDKKYFYYITCQNEEKHLNSIAKLVNQYSYEGIYRNHEEKSRIFYLILGYYYDELDRIIKKNIPYCLIMMLRLLEYNRHLALILARWARNFEENNSDFINEVADIFLKELLTKLEHGKKESEIHVLFRQYENMLALHQRGIELVIERIVYLLSKKNYEIIDENEFISEANIEKTFDLAFSITNFYNYKLLYTIGDLKREELILDENEGIVFPSFQYIFEDPEYAYFNYITTLRSSSSNENSIFYNVELNKKIKLHYGLTLEEMLTLLKKCEREHLTETFITDKEGFIDFIVKNTLFTKENVTIFVNNLCFKLEKNEFYIDGASRTRKVSRRFLVEIDGIFIFPYGLLVTSVLNIITDLSVGETEYDDLSIELNNNLKVKNKKFESNVLNALLSLPGAIVKKNIHALRYPDGTIAFPKEIDIILLYNLKIYIIECKDITLKTDMKKKSNFESKLRGDFSRKLSGKIKEASAHKKLLLKYIGDEEEVYINSEVRGLFVLSSFFNTNIKNTEYPIVLLRDLESFLKK